MPHLGCRYQLATRVIGIFFESACVGYQPADSCSWTPSTGREPQMPSGFPLLGPSVAFIQGPALAIPEHLATDITCYWIQRRVRRRSDMLGRDCKNNGSGPLRWCLWGGGDTIAPWLR